MDYDPISYLGLSCPSGGDFYICQENESQFLGCCDVDPCGSNDGQCPSSALHPSSFESDKYYEIPPQGCIPSTRNALWYTCTNGPTFLGCCVSNPCNNDGVCPQNNLAGAALNKDQSSASVFLTTPTSTSTSTSTSLMQTSNAASTSTSLLASPITSPAASSTSSSIPGFVSNKSSGPPIAGIVGGILGGIIALGLVALIFFLCRRRRRRTLATAELDSGVMTTPQPWSPYHDSFHSSSVGTPAPLSPLSSVSTPRSLAASFGSIIGFKRSSGRKKCSCRTSAGRETIDPGWPHVAHNNGYAGQGFVGPAMELDSSLAYYEVEGSVPDVRPKEMGRY
ncbi:hypothetical protein F5Y09DRAFT_350107 [Xylaria sp. FL1042]|nr:hypothetical protein F5Y09DRAFT_350107 [Xylaria sp. FL1042]